MRFATLMVVACLGCPGKSGEVEAPRRIDDTALRIRIAQAEARRGDGVAELLELTKERDKNTRLLALRGLGRIGGVKALLQVAVALNDPDPEIIAGAAAAIGVAMSLDEELPVGTAFTNALVRALTRSRERVRTPTTYDPTPVILEAIGRAGSADAQETIAPYLLDQPEVATAAAIALARHGRRRIELVPVVRARLVKATKHADVRVRYAAAHALAREQLPKSDDAGEKTTRAEAGVALAAMLADADATVRAQAAQALARRKAVTAHRAALARTLHDRDWRVAVEAMRALTGEASDRDGRRLAAIAMMFWLYSIEGEALVFPRHLGTVFRNDPVLASEAFGLVDDDEPERWVGTADPAGAHVVIEGLRGLAPHTGDQAVALVVNVGTRVSGSSKLPKLTAAWIECLTIAALTRGTAAPDYARLLDTERCRLPDHLRLPLVGELVAAKVGTLEQRRTALKPLLEHPDARVRVAGMTALASMWDDGAQGDRRAVVAMTIAALGAKDGLIAGTAVETAATLYTGIDKDKSVDMKDALDAAIIARAQTETDPELATALFGTINERKMAAGAAACRAGLRGAPVLVKAAVDCMKALGQPVEPPPIGPATAPPVDVATVIGQALTWKLVTTRGEIEIELRPDIAPWAVATVVTLTRKGYYDGLEVHRVVPDFVVQGGDPTESGWGGPGFTTPSEPGSLADGPGFMAGGVGVADAGRDSGGSQWFVMHSRAPHLDGRYTWIGSVRTGQKSADALLIGDTVTSATIEVAPSR